jgi:Tfp pilus assembly protein PilP
MIRIVGVFLLGVYIGQEYGNNIPNVSKKSLEIVELFRNTEIYGMLSRDLKKIKDKEKEDKKGWF